MVLIDRINKIIVLHIIRLILACGVSFILFIILPVIHDLFGMGFQKEKSMANQRRIIAEVIQPIEKKKKKEVRRLRKVHRSKTRSTAGNMQMKFTPNLGIEGDDGVAVESQDLEIMIFNEGETDEDVIPLKTIPIPYPQRARELGIEGIVKTKLVIGRNGKVESVQVLKTPHPSFASIVRKTMLRWRYKPAKNQGVPVRVYRTKEIEFKLK